MRPSSILCVALAMVLAGCGAIPRHLAHDSYTVSATMESYSDGTAEACFAIQLSYPGDCGHQGLPISHLGNAPLPMHAAARTPGAYLTPAMKLTGTWTGSSLALTVPPTRARAETAPKRVWSSTRAPRVAQMEGGRPTTSGLRDQQILMADLADLRSRGILVMEHGFDESGLFMMVAVGDPATIDLLRSRYNVQRIDAWLHPDN